MYLDPQSLSHHNHNTSLWEIMQLFNIIQAEVHFSNGEKLKRDSRDKVLKAIFAINTVS